MAAEDCLAAHSSGMAAATCGFGLRPGGGGRVAAAVGGWRIYPERLRNTMAQRRGEPDFSRAVKDAIDGCLACKSCSGQCPIKVDVPTFRAKFLDLYYGRYLRPARDYLVGSLETMLPRSARCVGPITSCWTASRVAPRLGAIGLVHTPTFSRVSMRRELGARGIEDATPQALAALSADERAGSVVLVQDAFTSWYETHVVLAVLDLMQTLGFRPFVAPFRPNGKPLHVHGFLGAFSRAAARNAAMLPELADTGVELVGVGSSQKAGHSSFNVAKQGINADIKS